MYVGIHTASLPQVFASAQRRIIFHAALYNRFAESQAHVEGLEQALSQPGFMKLQAITLPFAPKRGWMHDFLTTLRPGQTLGETEHEFNGSLNFLVRLAARHEGMVEIYETRSMPCTPVIIVDDRIFFGNYLHSEIMTPEGYWFGVTAPVEQLVEAAQTHKIPVDLTPRQKASYRYVSECVHAMRNAKRMLL